MPAVPCHAQDFGIRIGTCTVSNACGALPRSGLVGLLPREPLSSGHTFGGQASGHTFGGQAETWPALSHKPLTSAYAIQSIRDVASAIAIQPLTSTKAIQSNMKKSLRPKSTTALG